jgi:hypothetical protein
MSSGPKTAKEAMSGGEEGSMRGMKGANKKSGEIDLGDDSEETVPEFGHLRGTPSPPLERTTQARKEACSAFRLPISLTTEHTLRALFRQREERASQGPEAE